MKTFITHKNGFSGPQIEALDHAHAEMMAENTDPDLVVDGELFLTIESAEYTNEMADRLLKIFAGLE